MEQTSSNSSVKKSKRRKIGLKSLKRRSTVKTKRKKPIGIKSKFNGSKSQIINNNNYNIKRLTSKQIPNNNDNDKNILLINGNKQESDISINESQESTTKTGETEVFTTKSSLKSSLKSSTNSSSKSLSSNIKLSKTLSTSRRLKTKHKFKSSGLGLAKSKINEQKKLREMKDGRV